MNFTRYFGAHIFAWYTQSMTWHKKITNIFLGCIHWKTRWRALQYSIWFIIALQWHPNDNDSVSNHQPHDCLLNRLFRRRSKKTSKFRVTVGEFPAQKASNAENVSIWWHHHDKKILILVKSFINSASNLCRYLIVPYGPLICWLPVTTKTTIPWQSNVG